MRLVSLDTPNEELWKRHSGLDSIMRQRPTPPAERVLTVRTQNGNIVVPVKR